MNALIDDEPQNDLTELDLLRAANAAQDNVLRELQQKLDTARDEVQEWKRRVVMAQDDDKSFYEPQLTSLRAEIERLRNIIASIGVE